jgi:ring-1,2-phenylacetyl-CoA epoxidase subunit PaaA
MNATTTTTSAMTFEVKSIEDFRAMPEDFQIACNKIVVSHAINELYGAEHFEEPAIGFAPTPHAKALTCRVAMEEYSHHCRFYELGLKMGIAETTMDPVKSGKKPLSMFDTAAESWSDFVVLKLFGDLAELLQVEDLIKASFQPLRAVARTTLPEERFHIQFGDQFVAELCRSEEGRIRAQHSLDRLFPGFPACFGRPGSANNARFRRWGLKVRSNEEMVADYMQRARAIADRHGLVLPAVPYLSTTG